MINPMVSERHACRTLVDQHEDVLDGFLQEAVVIWGNAPFRFIVLLSSVLFSDDT